MERRRLLDVARPAPARPSLIRAVVAEFLLLCLSVLAAGQAPPLPNVEAEIKREFDSERWQKVVSLAEPLSRRNAVTDYYYGIALARLQRWPEAAIALREAGRQHPGDKRFPVELAGVEFKLKNYPVAARDLQRALRLDPQDSYANDFLGSVYFLEGNLEAALKYWNRVGKPRLESVTSDPVPRVDAALLDRAFAFSPASVLRQSEIYASEARIQGLEIFPRHSFDPQAREDGAFDLVFHNQERNGWGHNKWEGLFRMFRGLPFQSVHLDLYNLGSLAINFRSTYRWDPEKRRVFMDLSGPIRRDPKWRYHVGTDLRSENWNLLTSFTGPAELLGGLNLRREVVSASITSLPGGRWNWSTGVEVSHRDFRSVVPGSGLTPGLLAKGYQLKHLAQVDVKLWRIPEHRLTLEGTASTQIGRLWSQSPESFAKLQAGAKLHWFPQAIGDDYELQENLRAGKTFGDLPFDELFMLGLAVENDLWMRGHIGTRDGRKGSAPMGRNYFLSNWEVDKHVYSKGPLSVKVGPFVDTGKITDPTPGLGSGKWLWDMGLQVKPRVYGITAVFSYGRDLRSGRNAVYLTMGR